MDFSRIEVAHYHGPKDDDEEDKLESARVPIYVYSLVMCELMRRADYISVFIRVSVTEIECVFNQLLDDTPLPDNEVSSSELLVAYSHEQLQSGHTLMGCPSRSSMPQVDRGFVTLVASDYPGIEVCDPNGHWYLADGVSGPNNLLLLTGRALSHVTAGLCPISQYRVTNENRASLTFRLVPHANAILDCSPILAAGHCIRQVYQPIPASQFMDDSYAEEHAVSSHLEEPSESQGNFVSDPSLRSVLSDPLSGAFLEDAMVLQCGHSFGGVMLKKVIEMARCTICNGEVDPSSLFPNLALRAVATVVKMEDDRRLFHNAALRKRRKDVIEHTDVPKRTGSRKDNGELALDAESPVAFKGVQYPFVVGERVLIMVHATHCSAESKVKSQEQFVLITKRLQGNKRTPEKFIGKEAVITSQCLNGWYLVKALDSGESTRLQYRSLKKVPELQLQTQARLQPLAFLGGRQKFLKHRATNSSCFREGYNWSAVDMGLRIFSVFPSQPFFLAQTSTFPPKMIFIWKKNQKIVDTIKKLIIFGKPQKIVDEVIHNLEK
ncbi:unnamed protein product [Triticum turgidum subsp. durum]|uniref:PUB 62/63 C-terminal domain-containing protein n=1 Tax=Triticum turgidum subsp. durum TaxID=4567 RepID=A0A9R1B5H8_TRITD|nr:unnamed protein product [Triticum turgidum subsp. durum]